MGCGVPKDKPLYAALPLPRGAASALSSHRCTRPSDFNDLWWHATVAVSLGLSPSVGARSHIIVTAIGHGPLRCILLEISGPTHRQIISVLISPTRARIRREVVGLASTRPMFSADVLMEEMFGARRARLEIQQSTEHAPWELGDVPCIPLVHKPARVVTN